ncbi:MAG: FeoB-associated Cys-rich membrane protein [Clostridia bacterium]|nr:FeoB-associated Cys-rich membrane protein [Clostridia bacterium]
MSMKDWIIIALVVCILAAVVWYLYRAKKRGVTCVGCPHAKQCGGNCHHDCDTK